MRKKYIIAGCVGGVIGIGVSYLYFSGKVAAMGASNLLMVNRAAALSTELAETKAALETCIGSTLAKESSLEDFYRQVIEADRIDFTVFAEDGSPRRMVFDCPGRGKQ